MSERVKMKPILDQDGVELSCSNKCVWPPTHVTVYGRDLESLRNSVGENLYHRLKTWEKTCGLTSMEVSKCSGCHLLVRDGVPVTGPRTGSNVPQGKIHKGRIRTPKVRVLKP
jgi:hypothetical protein